jgi:hypothetical protein
MKKIFILMMISAFCAKTHAWEYPYQNIDDAFKATGFSPTNDNASFFVVLSDSHWGLGEEGIPQAFVDEINTFQPLPEFLLINGDIINSASVCFGNVPKSLQAKEKALNEFKDLKTFLGQLNPKISLKLTLGNHDTYPYEKDGGLFQQIFPDHKLYSSFELSGVHIVLLCGGQSGDIDEKQLAWLKQDIAKIPKNQTVILFAHQPAFAKIVRERGISEAIRSAFSEHTGSMWVVGGHCHYNSIQVFKLPKTKIVQTTIISSNSEKVKAPGYWVYCLEDGKVQSRIYREINSGFRIASKPNYSKAKAIPIPFGETKNRLWTLMVGDGDRQYLVKGKGGDVVTWWAYVKDLVYKLPLSKANMQATKIALLADLGELDNEDANQIYFSVDGENWQEQKLSTPVNKVYMLDIPEDMRKEQDLFVKIIGKNATCYFGGFALCK